MITSTVHAIKQLKMVDGVNMKGLQAFLEQIAIVGIDIKKPSHLGDEYFKKSIRYPFLDKLINNTEARFDDKSVLAS
jgi:wyosine [tRNA(Phe)-imidazoG37] synthetase (radical SAM superfamily)